MYRGKDDLYWNYARACDRRLESCFTNHKFWLHQLVDSLEKGESELLRKAITGMMRKPLSHRLVTSALVCILALLVCPPTILVDTVNSSTWPRSGRTYIINLDGMSGDWYNYIYTGSNQYNGCLTPNLVAIRESLPTALFTNCVNVLPAVTGTNHASIITSTPAGTHGILGVGSYYAGLNLSVPDPTTDPNYGTATFGRYGHEHLNAPTLFNSIKNYSSTLTTAVVAGKPWVGDIFDDEDCDIKVYPGNPENPSYVDEHVDGYILGGPPHEGDIMDPAHARWYFSSHQEEEPPDPPDYCPPLYQYFNPPLLSADDFPSDEWVVNQAISIINDADPDFMYLLMANIDDAGHAYGSFTDSDVEGLCNARNPNATADALYLTDAEVGRFIQFLNQTGRLSDSLLIFTADHGISSLKNEQRSVDLRDILERRGYDMIANDRSPSGHYNPLGHYAWLVSEGCVSYIYDVTNGYLDQIEDALLSYRDPVTHECPIWQVLNQSEQLSATSEITGLPYNMYHPDFDSVIWPDLVVLMEPNYPIPFYYDQLYGGTNAFMLDIRVPPTGTTDVPTSPGAHGTYSEQHVPLMITGLALRPGLTVTDQVSTLDIVPTMCDMHGWPLFDEFRGESLIPLMYQDNTRMYIDPSRTPASEQIGYPGDEYTLSVNLDCAVNVWAVQFTIEVAPYVSVLSVSGFTEGDFLSEGGSHSTLFDYTTNAFAGRSTVTVMRRGDPPREGVTGSGTLASFKICVVEAGESPINLIDTTLLDPEGNLIRHKASDGFYVGSTASLIRVNLPGGRKITAGENFTINAKVRNDGDIPLYVTVRLDISRTEDARKIEIRPGQTYFGGGLGEPRPFEYLYVDEFNELYYEWNNPPENLFGEPDGLYIEGDANAQWASLYSFESITLAGREIADIFLEGYARYPNGATEAVDIDVHDVAGGFAWWGSLWGTTDWGWHGVRWTTDSVLTTSPRLADEAELNNVEILVYNYHGDAPNIIQLDSMRLKVEFANIFPVVFPVYEVLPDEELELDDVIWVSTLDHLGSYELTATIEYTSEYFKWNSWGSKQKTLFFSIVGP